MYNILVLGDSHIDVFRFSNMKTKYFNFITIEVPGATAMGSTNPKEAKDGTIRSKFGLNIQENSVHGSDSKENADIEISFFFNENEIVG